MRTVRRRDDRGATAVEFALVSVPFFILVFGIIAFGVIFAQDLALGNGAREAARYSVVGSRTCGQIESAAQDASNGIAMSGSAVKVTVKVGQSLATATQKCSSATAADDAVVPCAGSAAGDSAFVVLDFNSSLIIPLVVVKNSFAISGNGVFRCEFS